MKNIAVILARSGSKGLADKNIKELNGKPLMAYSIEAALESGLFDIVHVSTDSEKYAQIARKYGADVRFLRSVNNASDTANSWDAIEEVLDKYEDLGLNFDTICLLQPTSPLRKSQDIVEAYELKNKKQAKAIVSVCKVEHSPRLSNILPEDGDMNGFIEASSSVPRQNMDQYYRLNGAIYIVDADFLKENHFIYREGCYAYQMDVKKSVDIDSEMDFRYAEFLMKEGY